MTDYVRRIARCSCALLIGLCAGLPAVAFPSSELTLAKEGKTSYMVVQSDDATEPEKFAVAELTNFLSRVTGASFPVATESSRPKDAYAIYVGWTTQCGAGGH